MTRSALPPDQPFPRGMRWTARPVRDSYREHARSINPTWTDGAAVLPLIR
jgi:hypothetical protein